MPGGKRATKLPLVVVGLLLAAMACSSAPTRDGTTAVGTEASAQATLPTGPTGLPPNVTASSPADARSPRAAVPSPTSPGTRDRTRAGGAPNLGAASQGVTATRIKIGYWIINFNGQCAAVGVTSSACQDADSQEVDALNRYVNANGGIAGRQIEPIVRITALERSSYATEAQAACEFFALDRKVFAVLLPSQVERPDFVYCMARHRVPVIDAGAWPWDSRDLRNVGDYLYLPARPRPERWVAAYIDGLHAQGFFGRGTRIGLVRFDRASFTRVTNQVLKPRLAAHGLRLAEEAVIRTPDNTGSGYGSMSAEINNAILRFNGADVNRVLFLATQVEMQFLWFPAAEAQNFHPRYGLSSPDWPSFQEEMAPAPQLRGSLGVGWMPGYDVAPDRDPGGSPGAARCARALRNAGLDPGVGRNPKCDNIFFLKAALDRAVALNPAGLRQGVERIGSSFTPASTLSTRFGPGRYDGPASVRYLAFDDGCGCFRYRGAPRSLP